MKGRPVMPEGVLSGRVKFQNVRHYPTDLFSFPAMPLAGPLQGSPRNIEYGKIGKAAFQQMVGKVAVTSSHIDYGDMAGRSRLSINSRDVMGTG